MLADIEITSNNVKLLSEMLKSYCDGSGSLNDLELIKELYNTVKQLEPKVQTMLSLEIPENEDTVRKYIYCDFVWLIFDSKQRQELTYKKMFVNSIFNILI